MGSSALLIRGRPMPVSHGSDHRSEIARPLRNRFTLAAAPTLSGTNRREVMESSLTDIDWPTDLVSIARVPCEPREPDMWRSTRSIHSPIRAACRHNDVAGGMVITGIVTRSQDSLERDSALEERPSLPNRRGQ